MKWLSLMLFATGVWAQAEIVKLPVVKIYAPKGFDSNDTAQVIVSGYLPDLCFQSPRHSVQRLGNKFTVSVEGSYLKGEEQCIDFQVPFLEEVTLGELSAGNYKVAIQGDQNKAAEVELVITKASSLKRDDFVYADVKFIEENDADRVVKLVGYHPNNCLQLEKVEMVSNGTDALSLLPILKYVPGDCTEGRVPFSYEYTVPELPEMARGVLLHVRVMDGRSVNHLFQNKLLDKKSVLEVH